MLSRPRRHEDDDPKVPTAIFFRARISQSRRGLERGNTSRMKLTTPIHEVFTRYIRLKNLTTSKTPTAKLRGPKSAPFGENKKYNHINTKAYVIIYRSRRLPLKIQKLKPTSGRRGESQVTWRASIAPAQPETRPCHAPATGAQFQEPAHLNIIIKGKRMSSAVRHRGKGVRRDYFTAKFVTSLSSLAHAETHLKTTGISGKKTC